MSEKIYGPADESLAKIRKYREQSEKSPTMPRGNTPPECYSMSEEEFVRKYTDGFGRFWNPTPDMIIDLIKIHTAKMRQRMDSYDIQLERANETIFRLRTEMRRKVSNNFERIERIEKEVLDDDGIIKLRRRLELAEKACEEVCRCVAMGIQINTYSSAWVKLRQWEKVKEE